MVQTSRGATLAARAVPEIARSERCVQSGQKALVPLEAASEHAPSGILFALTVIDLIVLHFDDPVLQAGHPPIPRAPANVSYAGGVDRADGRCIRLGHSPSAERIRALRNAGECRLNSVCRTQPLESLEPFRMADAPNPRLAPSTLLCPSGHGTPTSPFRTKPWPSMRSKLAAGARNSHSTLLTIGRLLVQEVHEFTIPGGY